MKKIAVILMVALAVLVVAVPVAAMEERRGEIYLYQAYEFSHGTLGEGTVALSYVVAGDVAAEKGLNGVWAELMERILARYLFQDRKNEKFSSYIVNVAVYPYGDIPAAIFEEEVDRLFLEVLLAIRG